MCAGGARGLHRQNAADPRGPDPTPTATVTAVPTAAPTPTPPPVPTATATAQPGPCICDRDWYKCSNFGSQANAQACFDYCWDQTGARVTGWTASATGWCVSPPLGWRVWGMADERASQSPPSGRSPALW